MISEFHLAYLSNLNANEKSMNNKYYNIIAVWARKCEIGEIFRPEINS